MPPGWACRRREGEPHPHLPACPLLVVPGDLVPNRHEDPQENVQEDAEPIRKNEDRPEEPNQPGRHSQPVPDASAHAADPVLAPDSPELGSHPGIIGHRPPFLEYGTTAHTKPSGPAPETRAHTVLPSRGWTFPLRRAATEAAPLRSAAIPISNQSHRAASSMSSSVTRTISSTHRWTISRLMGSVRRAASVGTRVVMSGRSTTWPAFRLSKSVAAPVGSTPTMRTDGRSALTARPIPLISPPPPMATNNSSISGAWSRISRAFVPCPVIT